MNIHKIQSENRTINFYASGWVGRNKLDILTGPNGSGKTEALTTLVEEYCKPESSEEGHGVGTLRQLYTPIAVESSSLPSRVLAQTFSPFTRFREPPRKQDRLFEIYGDGAQRAESYICVGLHRAFRGVASHLSRKTLEEALFRVSEFPEATESLLGVMTSLGFRPSLRLVYAPRVGMARLFRDPHQGIVYEFLQSKLEEGPKFSTPLAAGVNEALESRSLDEVATAITDALIEARALRRKGMGASMALEIDLASSKREFYLLQAFSLLRRLGVLHLQKCEVRRMKGKEPFDVANASSGEQQMLCSIFGLASAIRNDALVLIDEPELSLHPKRQIDFVDAIESLLKMVSGCHVIIATHSPVVVQAAQTLGAAITQLGELPTGELTVSSFANDSASQALSVEQALLDVFETPVPRSAHVSNQIFKAVVSAETGDAREREQAKDELEALDRLYEDSRRGDPTPALIKDALRIVNAAGDEDESDSEAFK